MMKMLSVAATAALLTGLSAPAMAQSYMPNWNAQPNWTGLSLGVVGSANKINDQDDESLRFDRNLDGNFGDTVTTAPPANANAFSPGSCDGAPRGNLPSDGCDDDSQGSEIGIRAGYDYQMGSFVVGISADYSIFTGAEDSVTSFSTTPAYYTFERDVNNIAAIRARVGYAYGPALIYGTGGVATAEVSNRFYSSNGTNTFTSRTEAGQADGYQAGGGVEYMLAPHLGLTTEYIYSSLEARDVTVRIGRGTSIATNPFILADTRGTDAQRSNDRIGLHAIRVGLNYRF